MGVAQGQVGAGGARQCQGWLVWPLSPTCGRCHPPQTLWYPVHATAIPRPLCAPAPQEATGAEGGGSRGAPPRVPEVLRRQTHQHPPQAAHGVPPSRPQQGRAGKVGRHSGAGRVMPNVRGRIYARFPQEEPGGDACLGMLNAARCGSQPVPSFPARRGRTGGQGWTRVPGPDCPGDGISTRLQLAEIKGDEQASSCASRVEQDLLFMRKEGPAASLVLRTAPVEPPQGLCQHPLAPTSPPCALPGEPVAPKGVWDSSRRRRRSSFAAGEGEMGSSVGRAAAEHSLMPKANPTPRRWFASPGMSTELPSSSPSEETPSVSPRPSCSAPTD
ncbi:uncharacterized protein LOC134556867 [Prinia subflava]|uniref:uncharacterized protein LOC134556867 n=1 Tax=Prinia subflava TaxID=208062 RepID=UPI002FE3E004